LQNSLLDQTTYEYGDRPNLSDTAFVSNLKTLKMRVVDNDKNVGSYDGVEVHFGLDSLFDMKVRYPYSYEITKAPLTIMADNVTREYGKDNPTLTCSYYGLKYNETEDDLIQKAEVRTAATSKSDAGSYPIIALGAKSNNYEIKYEQGTLTINKASQEITWDQEIPELKIGESVELTATSNSGLPVSYVSSDESVAGVYKSKGKSYLTCLKEGRCFIHAVQEGDKNHSAAERATKVINAVSGIEGIEVDKKKCEYIYDLQGRKLSEPQTGINIINGKKVIVTNK